MKQLDGVYEIETGTSRIFVITGQKNFLVDTGSAAMPDAVIKFMEASGFSYNSEAEKDEARQGACPAILRFLEARKLALSAVICTHFHSDHTGNLKKLHDALGVPAALHEADIPLVDGTEEFALPDTIPPEVRESVRITACPVGMKLRDGQLLSDEVRVIHVPGHTRGSICLPVKNRVLIAGDCMIGKTDRNPAAGFAGTRELNPPVPMFSLDYAQALKSLERLREFEFEAVLPTHGESVWAGGKEKFIAMLQGIAGSF